MVIPVPPAHVTMTQWNIVVIVHKGKTIEKFLGLCVNDQDYRISSQILEYDLESNRGLTDSGSVYEFMDAPGKLHPKAQVIFDKLNAWGEVNVSLKFEVSNNTK